MSATVIQDSCHQKDPADTKEICGWVFLLDNLVTKHSHQCYQQTEHEKVTKLFVVIQYTAQDATVFVNNNKQTVLISWK